MRSFEFVVAHDLDECLDSLQGGNAQPIAGGQSLLLEMKRRESSPRVLVSLADLPELKMARYTSEGGLHLGATMTYRDLTKAPSRCGPYFGLGAIAADIADRPVRNMATVGGALCQADMRFDMPMITVLLDGSVLLQSSKGRRVLAAKEFLVGNNQTQREPDELMLGVNFPPRDAGLRWSFKKFRLRCMDASIVSVACAAELDSGDVLHNVRIVVGACLQRPTTITAIETELSGQRLSATLIDDASSEFADVVHLDTPSSYPDVYRKAVAARLFREALGDLTRPQPA